MGGWPAKRLPYSIKYGKRTTQNKFRKRTALHLVRKTHRRASREKCVNRGKIVPSLHWYVQNRLSLFVRAGQHAAHQGSPPRADLCAVAVVVVPTPPAALVVLAAHTERGMALVPLPSPPIPSPTQPFTIPGGEAGRIMRRNSRPRALLQGELKKYILPPI